MDQDRTSDDQEGSSSASSKHPLIFKLLASVCSILVLIFIDLGLNLLGLVPPEAPLISHAKTYMEDFSPFMESEDGILTVKPQWISKKAVLRARRGELAGRFFLYPGFHPCRIERIKPSETIRIFVFGGSTTFGLFVGNEASFPGLIQKELQDILPDHDVEVINLGCSGLDSTRIRILMNAAIELDPDLLVIYAGHNEMLMGDTGTRAVASPKDVHRRLLSVSAIYRWMNYGLSSFRTSREYEIVKDEATSLLAGNIPVYDPLELPVDQRRLPSKDFVEGAVSNYYTNILGMASKAQKASVPILFVLPISNLFHPPYVSAHEDGFAGKEEYDSLLKDAWNVFREGAADRALPTLDHTIELSPSYAMAWYMRGVVRLSLGQREDGFADLQKACDLDARTHRLTSRLQSAMMDAVETSGARWVDLRPDFYKEFSPAYSKTVFIDHCHPTEYGHRLIAERLLPYITELLQLGDSEMLTNRGQMKKGFPVTYGDGR